jgi:hypothetical protein
MKTKNNTKKITVTKAMLTSTSLLGVPTEAATPTPPKGFEPSRYRGRPVMRVQASLATTVADELEAAVKTVGKLGPYAPPPAVAAESLRRAKEWSRVAAAASVWDAYVREQTAKAWDTALGQVEAFEPLIEVASAHDVEVRHGFETTMRFIAARRLFVSRKKAKPEATQTAENGGDPPADKNKGGEDKSKGGEDAKTKN